MTFNLEPPAGFQGLHAETPVTVYQRHLPHWRQRGATYFVTFRLADSLPQSKLSELMRLREAWDRCNPLPRSREQMEGLWREVFLRVDQWLDEGAGRCHLNDEGARRIVSNALRHFDNERYELGSYVVMPNHVHLVVRPYDEADEALSQVTRSWKRHTSLEVNKILGLDGALWQAESYDRIIRDEEHLWRTVQYVGRNPGKARLDRGQFQAWINPAWQALGWRFVEEG